MEDSSSSSFAGRLVAARRAVNISSKEMAGKGPLDGSSDWTGWR